MSLPVIAHAIRKWKKPPDDVELVEKELVIERDGKVVMIHVDEKDDDRFYMATSETEFVERIQGMTEVLVRLNSVFS